MAGLEARGRAAGRGQGHNEGGSNIEPYHDDTPARQIDDEERARRDNGKGKEQNAQCAWLAVVAAIVLVRQQQMSPCRDKQHEQQYRTDLE